MSKGEHLTAGLNFPNCKNLVNTGGQFMKDKSNPTAIYSGDSIKATVKGYVPTPQTVPYGADVKGVYFDGYPQIIKQEGSKPVYQIKKEKDVMLTLRDGGRIAVDIYRPDIAGEKFPAILAYGLWGKDAQEAVAWNWDKPQPYYDSPFWDGTMEAGNYLYTVPRGYAHVIPDPRGIGNSEGPPTNFHNTDDPKDISDVIEWIAAQPWCNGKVGMMGPSSYSRSQIVVAEDPPPHLVAIHPDEGGEAGIFFHGIWDTTGYHIWYGRHGNDSTPPQPNTPRPPVPPMMLSLPKEDLESRLREALNHPDIKYNTKWYSLLRYPFKSPANFDQILESFHPRPVPSTSHKITLPMYIGTPWVTKLYIWDVFHTWEKTSTPMPNKKLIVYPPGFPPRPYALYHDETIRWYDYWLKGIDTGIMDEPPIKLFVMGINKWKFENEWPLARTQWTKYYLHPGGHLSTDPVKGAPEPDTFTQPAPYLDPTVYCLKYNTGPLDRDIEITGPIAMYLDASIDIDDTNWMVDLVDLDPEGNRQWLSAGYLKAKFRALDKENSRPYQPIHPRQDPVPVPPGEKIQYAIAMMPTSAVLQKGHSMELIIRNQDDILSRLGTWGTYMLPFMQTVTHAIHLGNSHILLPIIPATKNSAT
jgi:putative CocE/NonD family hydrolase